MLFLEWFDGVTHSFTVGDGAGGFSFGCRDDDVFGFSGSTDELLELWILCTQIEIWENNLLLTLITLNLKFYCWRPKFENGQINSN